MSLILSGTDGLSDVDGTAATPAIRGTDANTGIFFPSADTIAFAEGGAEVARFDSSGNFGLGVTPSAWNNVFKAVQINAQGCLMATSTTMQMGNNIFYDGAYKFIGTGYASRYYQATGQHVWTVSTASGTAGGAITETQAMTLDASGRLLLGPTSGTGMSANDLGMVNGGSIRFRNAANSAWLNMINVDSSNNLNFGVGGVPTTITFGISGVGEAGRFDTSGNLLVGTTSVNSVGVISVDFLGQTKQGITLDDTWASTGGVYILFRNSAGDTAGRIDHNGTTTVAYTTSSDYRLKENIAPMTGALAKVLQLNPVTYKWKSDGTDGQGFIAHELQAIVPDAVVGAKDAVEEYTDEDGNEQTRIKPQGIDTSFLVATLTAAIQEQQALITQLTARITALESA